MRVWLIELVGVTVPGSHDTQLPAVFAYSRRPLKTRWKRRNQR